MQVSQTDDQTTYFENLKASYCNGFITKDEGKTDGEAIEFD